MKKGLLALALVGLCVAIAALAIYLFNATTEPSPETYTAPGEENMVPLPAQFKMRPQFTPDSTQHPDADHRAPWVYDGPPDVELLGVGWSTQIYVQVYGEEPFTYQWRKNGTVLAGATRAFLNIEKAIPASAGEYDCVVTNAFGADTSRASTVNVVHTNPLRGARD